MKRSLRSGAGSSARRSISPRRSCRARFRVARSKRNGFAFRLPPRFRRSLPSIRARRCRRSIAGCRSSRRVPRNSSLGFLSRVPELRIARGRLGLRCATTEADRLPDPALAGAHPCRRGIGLRESARAGSRVGGRAREASVEQWRRVDDPECRRARAAKVCPEPPHDFPTLSESPRSRAATQWSQPDRLGATSSRRYWLRVTRKSPISSVSSSATQSFFEDAQSRPTSTLMHFYRENRNESAAHISWRSRSNLSL